MKINSKKNHLPRSIVIFILLLFAVCAVMNGFFGSSCASCGAYDSSDLYKYHNSCSAYNFSDLYKYHNSCSAYNSLDFYKYHNSCSSYKSYELTGRTASLAARLISENSAANEDDKNTIYPVSMIAVFSRGYSLLLFPAIIFLLFFSVLFRLLPDRWTLINQKVRLDN